jgi:hypothetical protein
MDSFAYDDDPASDRDTSAINYFENDAHGPDYEYTRDDPGYGWIPAGEWITHGWLWRFTTQHFNDYVFEDHVMPTINGHTKTREAADALGHHVDDVTCFGNPRPLTNSFCASIRSCAPFTNINQCSNIAGLLTAFNRAAGIPARPVWIDWIQGSFDHSTEVWTEPVEGGANQWYVMRGYNGSEGSCPSPYYTGINQLKHLGWYTSGQGCTPPVGTGMLTSWEALRKRTIFHLSASWDLAPGSQDRQDREAAWFESRFRAYLGWPRSQMPGPQRKQPSLPAAGGQEVSRAEVGGETALEFGQVLADRGVDTDGDGRFDQLVFEVQVNIFQPGDYWIRGQLDANFVHPVGGDGLAEAIGHLRTRSTARTGGGSMDICMSKANGPTCCSCRPHVPIPPNPISSNELAYTQPPTPPPTSS